MPYYEYVCSECGHTVTEKRTVAERNERLPVCQHGEVDHPFSFPMDRVLSRGNFVLKGSGWAKDGYASKT